MLPLNSKSGFVFFLAQKSEEELRYNVEAPSVGDRSREWMPEASQKNLVQ